MKATLGQAVILRLEKARGCRDDLFLSSDTDSRKDEADAVEKLRGLHRGSLSNGYSIQDDPRIGKLIHPETPIEQVLTEVPKLPLETRRQVYSNVSNRLAAAGELSRAQTIIADNFSDEALESAQAELARQHVHHTINAGRFAEAEAL